MSLAPIHVCHACISAARVRCAGACPCPVDGRDISEHAQAASCPAGKFSGAGGTAGPLRRQKPHKPDIPLAGDVVEQIAQAVGADRLAKLWERWTGKPCGCKERRERLNAATVRLLKWWASRTTK